MAFDKFVHFFPTLLIIHTHTQFFCQRYWWELAVAMDVTFKRGCNPNLSGVRRGRHWDGFREGKCESVGLCATPIIQLNYVILNHIYLQRQGIIKAANMVENCIKLRQDKVDYVHE